MLTTVVKKNSKRVHCTNAQRLPDHFPRFLGMWLRLLLSENPSFLFVPDVTHYSIAELLEFSPLDLFKECLTLGPTVIRNYAMKPIIEFGPLDSGEKQIRKAHAIQTAGSAIRELIHQYRRLKHITHPSRGN